MSVTASLSASQRAPAAPISITLNVRTTLASDSLPASGVGVS